MALNDFLGILPEIKPPVQKKLSFKEKLKWTLLMLLAFFILSVIPLFGLGQNSLSQFEFLSIILGASFGSIMSLGIGPIVTASIVLQLLVGSGILKIDNTTHEGRQKFQGLQKFLGIFFVIFEAIIYVLLGGLAPAAGINPWVIIIQLIMGGILVLYMDEVVSKWGFGSGVSLFIAAGVSTEIFVRAFSPLSSAGVFALGTEQAPVGAVLAFIISLINQDIRGAGIAIASILATILVFVMAVYAQSMKVEIPLSFGRVRGHGIRWPLKFLYTSNIPVILISALLANVQLWAHLLQSWGHPLLGTFVGNTPASGIVAWIFGPDLIGNLIRGSFVPIDLLKSLAYVLFMIIGSVVFGIFWVQTSGMDAKSQARQIMSSGLQIPGFRRDERVLEHVLNRYIFPLTIMGAMAVGLLASVADLSSALSRGTGILLAVMIIYQLYETIAQQHAVDMHPALRKMMEK